MCIVAGPDIDAEDALAAAHRRADLAGIGKPVDLRVFEELPLYLQGAILSHHAVVLAEDEPALYEYLRFPRKLWADQAHRQTLTAEEARRMIRSEG